MILSIPRTGGSPSVRPRSRAGRELARGSPEKDKRMPCRLWIMTIEHFPNLGEKRVAGEGLCEEVVRHLGFPTGRVA